MSLRNLLLCRQPASLRRWLRHLPCCRPLLCYLRTVHVLAPWCQVHLAHGKAVDRQTLGLLDPLRPRHQAADSVKDNVAMIVVRPCKGRVVGRVLRRHRARQRTPECPLVRKVPAAERKESAAPWIKRP